MRLVRSKKNKTWALFFLLIVISCVQRKNDEIIGIFSNHENFYEFTSDSLKVFKLQDSVVKKYKLTYEKGYLKVGDKLYSYKKKSKDSILFDSSLNGDGDGNNIYLKRFSYNNFNIENLNNTEWELEEKNDSVNFYIRVVENKGIYNFYKRKEENYGELNFFSYYENKLFNKFYLFSDTKYFFLSYYDQDKLIIQYLYNNKWVEKKYKKINANEIDQNLIGDWIKIKEDSKNKIAENHYNFLLDSSSESKRKYKKFIDFSNLKFTDDGFLNRIILFEKDKLFLKNKISYNKNTKYLFIDDFSKSRGLFFEEEQLYFKVLEITSDTLKIQISKPNIINLYVRDNKITQ